MVTLVKSYHPLEKHPAPCTLSSRVRRLLFPLLFALLLGLAIWAGFRAAEQMPVAAAPRLTGTVTQPGGNAVTPSSLSPASPEAAPDPVDPDVATAITRTTTTAPSTTPTAQPLSGGEQVEQWLSSSTDIKVVAQNILAGFPLLATEDHLLAASKLVALVGDDRFEGLKRLILDPKTSTEAKEFLVRDALSRADTVKLPLMLAIMQQRGHPSASEAHDTLISALGADYGADYGQWQARINEVLRAQQ